jgi:hypothetical protein
MTIVTLRDITNNKNEMQFNILNRTQSYKQYTPSVSTGNPVTKAMYGPPSS